jgi:hypothetical protein
MLPLLVGAVVLFGWQARAWGQVDVTQYTQETFFQWLEKYRNAKPDFKPGEVLVMPQDAEKIRPFIFPGYFEELATAPDLRLEITAPKDHTPRRDYLECTERFQKQVKLKADGSLENYVCGQPFANADLDPKDPTSGIKAAWNFDHRWQKTGLSGLNFLATWVRKGGTHTPPEIEQPPPFWAKGITYDLGEWRWVPPEIYKGGGTFQRSLGTFYNRFYFTHMPMYPGNNYTFPGAPPEVYWKEFTGFFSPFDVRGTSFIIFRYEDPYRADDGWAYVPSLRRVRRISAEVKSDSLVGTDHTLEDFYSFSGRPLDWNWKFHGWKDLLAIHDSRYSGEGSRYTGPNGWLPDDIWQVRKFAIMERTPKDPRHPYKGCLESWEAQNWDAWLMVCFDRKGSLWKVWEFQKDWTEDFKRFKHLGVGSQTTNFQSIQVIDVQNGRGTIWNGYGTGYPDLSLDYINELYDLNKLTEAHR